MPSAGATTSRSCSTCPVSGPDSIELTVERNVLTVKAERQWWPDEGTEVLARERTQGAFSRQVLLGEALDADVWTPTTTRACSP